MGGIVLESTVKYTHKKMAAIFLENDNFPSGKAFVFEIAQALREYADSLESCEKGTAGSHSPEIFNSSGGTQIKSIVGSWTGDKNSLQDKGFRPDLIKAPKSCLR